uniref:Uncharacterized protein n=1 Tax=Rhizophora mucronata TaxID=61149 RepID=A0A2P2NEM9_RHIMU
MYTYLLSLSFVHSFFIPIFFYVLKFSIIPPLLNNLSDKN